MKFQAFVRGLSLMAVFFVGQCAASVSHTSAPSQPQNGFGSVRPAWVKTLTTGGLTKTVRSCRLHRNRLNWLKLLWSHPGETESLDHCCFVSQWRRHLLFRTAGPRSTFNLYSCFCGLPVFLSEQSKVTVVLWNQ